MEYVKETWERDEKRIDKIKTKFNSDVIIIWEQNYRDNKAETIGIVLNEIDKIKKNKNGNN